MIDWHCHILPGIDDGAAEEKQSLDMAASLALAGFTEVYCTPHLMKGCFEAGNSEVRLKTAELQARLDDMGLPIRLSPSREYFLDEYLLLVLDY